MPIPQYELRRYGPLNNWYAFYSEGRRSKSLSGRSTDKAEAREFIDAYLTEKYIPAGAKPEDLELCALLRRYHEEKSDEVMSADTAKRTFNHLVEYYAGKTVAYINKTSNKQYERDAKERGWANSTINRARNTLRAALNAAEEDGVLTKAPNIPTLPVPVSPHEWLTRDQEMKLYRAVLPKRWRYMNLFIRIGLATGARHEAILSLTWDRVDLETGVIDFRVPGRVETKKKRPHAPVNERLLRLLRATKKISNHEHVVVHRGGRLQSVGAAFEKACKRAKLKGFTPHSMKHTYITRLLRAGASVWDVAGLTSTSATTIEKHYGHHARDSRMRDVANMIL